MFNIADTRSREEALLAVGFIFTIHFFNGHLRPKRFPMDTVIFTGRSRRRARGGARASSTLVFVREGRSMPRGAPADRGIAVVRVGRRRTALVLGIVAIVLIVYGISSLTCGRLTAFMHVRYPMRATLLATASARYSSRQFAVDF